MTKNLHNITKKYIYETVDGDENQVRKYTLENGLTVFLAPNTDAPKIQTYIAVRAGSNNDPAENTGLAHYLEHMMFKGTSKIGAANWEKENVLLQKIEELFEEHKKAADTAEKKNIYAEIDRLSSEASQYAVANEYDKLMSSIGAAGTNAHTWHDETVYKNTIPNNELEKWLMVERERFSGIALRLFHTELETVYEEFNRSQDNDGRLVNNALMELLFPQHPNGQQNTLGKAEHLKNPSMKAIHEYYKRYYAPNNMAIVLVGDLEFDRTIELVEKYFGILKRSETPKKNFPVEQPLNNISERRVFSPSVPRVQIAWRTDSYGTREAMLADMVSQLLSNRNEAGLLDLKVNQKQKALYSQAYFMGLKEYGFISAVIVPKEGDSLHDSVEILLSEIDNIKSGNFPDWMLPAIVKDFEVQRMKAWETADGLATNIYETYIRERTWAQELAEPDEYRSITKDEIIKFANEFFRENYCVVYKEQGENQELLRVESPEITPVEINRNAESEFYQNFTKIETPEIMPVFIDYQQEIQNFDIHGRQLNFIRNSKNNLAQLHFIFPFGNDSGRDYGLALQYLQFIGTDQLSPQQIKLEFFKIVISCDFKVQADEIIIILAGLEQGLPEGIKLLKNWIEHAKPDVEIYRNFVQTIIESREAAKKDKTRIMQSLVNYAKFGPQSRQRDVLSTEQLVQQDPEELTDILHQFLNYSFEYFYYGNDVAEISKNLSVNFVRPSIKTPKAKIYPEIATGGHVYFTNYDMVQVEMSRVARGENVNFKNFGKINVFNEYFGHGLSSLVFQEMRERKSLAYSAYVNYNSAQFAGRHDYISTYIGTQPDKLGIAVETLNELMHHLPYSKNQFENAKSVALKQIASGRITRTNIFFNFRRIQKLGLDYDIRKDIYAEILNLDFEKLQNFYQSKIMALDYNTAIIGKRESIDENAISALGKFEELSVEQIFNF